MIGPEGVAEAIRARLAVDVAARVALLDPEAPAPATVTAQERPQLAIDDYPAMFVIVQAMTAMEAEGLNVDGHTVYRCRYPTRVFVLVRGDTYDGTDLLRKRYVLAVREALLTAQTATRVDETTLRESYSDVGVDPDARNARNIAGAWVEADVVVDEVLGSPVATPAPLPDGWNTVVVETAIRHSEAFD